MRSMQRRPRRDRIMEWLLGILTVALLSLWATVVFMHHAEWFGWYGHGGWKLAACLAVAAAIAAGLAKRNILIGFGGGIGAGVIAEVPVLANMWLPEGETLPSISTLTQRYVEIVGVVLILAVIFLGLNCYDLWRDGGQRDGRTVPEDEHSSARVTVIRPPSLPTLLREERPDQKGKIVHINDARSRRA